MNLRGEITNMVYYTELDYLISGAGDGKIIFWSADGQIIKQMSMFKKGVANIKAFERSKEYDASLTNAQKIKKHVEFKAFRKYYINCCDSLIFLDMRRKQPDILMLTM